jgi:hypothetical protein
MLLGENKISSTLAVNECPGVEHTQARWPSSPTNSRKSCSRYEVLLAGFLLPAEGANQRKTAVVLHGRVKAIGHASLSCF